MVADSRFVFPLPSKLDPVLAAPLLCAGATVYAPLKRYVKPGMKVGILGIGGLGHLALQFAKALGCTVYAFSSSKDKEAEAKGFGADTFINTQNLDPKKWVSNFDFILSTVNVDLNWNLYLSLLKPGSTLCFVGLPKSPLNIDVNYLISGQRSVSGSTVANRATLKEMLEFATQHQIRPKVEKYPLENINVALERLRSNQARYRIVLTT
jgi:uncharacterized zinc-type alcohol dehydrogenase-like protein